MVPTRGLYNISAVFTEPGNYEFTLGLLVNVTDICDDTYFPEAPVLTPYDVTYYVGQGNLEVSANYLEDFITGSTTTSCGNY